MPAILDASKICPKNRAPTRKNMKKLPLQSKIHDVPTSPTWILGSQSSIHSHDVVLQASHEILHQLVWEGRKGSDEGAAHGRHLHLQNHREAPHKDQTPRCPSSNAWRFGSPDVRKSG